MFDGYKYHGIQESISCARDKGASRTYKLGPNTCLPPQKVVLTVTSNKAQLIDLICDDLTTHTYGDSQHMLTVTVTTRDVIVIYNIDVLSISVY